jgi:pyruvate formate lyase activating enzyme
MGDGHAGYCGIRGKKGKEFYSLSSPQRGLLSYYLDAHVTNCCSAWFCPAGTGTGYPKYACRPEAEYHYYNLAIFFYGCCFDCLFCQNWTHKVLKEAGRVSDDELVNLTMTNDRISCWCWFGGSPEPQLPFAVSASRKMLQTKPRNRIVRMCYEWNGDGNPILVRRAAETAFESGGNIKFDLKAYNPTIHQALTGRSNERTLENFRLVYQDFYERRLGMPVLTATTLLVPYYVDEVEVGRIAESIASLNDEIPYSLLVFHPDFEMVDLPVTPDEQVTACYRAAKRFLKRVNIGNVDLLRIRSYVPWGSPAS